MKNFREELMNYLSEQYEKQDNYFSTNRDNMDEEQLHYYYGELDTLSQTLHWAVNWKNESD